MSDRITFDELIKDKIFKEGFEGFLRVEEISDVIIIGAEGGIRRIIFGDENSLLGELRKKVEGES